MNAKRPGLDDSCKGRLLSPRFHSALTTLQIFTGVYRVFSGKSESRDFRIAGFTCMSAFSINSVGVPFMDFAGKL